MKPMRNPMIAVISVLLLLVVAHVAPSSAEGEAAAELDGQAVFLEHKCNMCHAVPAAGIEAKIQSEKMKGPDIDGLEIADADQMGKYLRKQGQIDGKDHKKEFKGSDEEMDVLLAWLQEQKKE